MGMVYIPDHIEKRLKDTATAALRPVGLQVAFLLDTVEAYGKHISNDKKPAEASRCE